MAPVFLFVATKNYHRSEARLAIRNLFSIMPDSKIYVYTDFPSDFDGFPNFNLTAIQIEQPQYSFRDKARALASFKEEEKFIFLDSDIFVGKPIYELFEKLEEVEVEMALASVKSNLIEPDLNSGVLGFRRTKRVLELLAEWRDIMDNLENGAPDQPELTRLIYKKSLKLHVLPQEYNLRAGQVCAFSGLVKVVHLHWNNKYNFPLKELFNFLNTTKEIRCWIPKRGEMHTQDGQVFVFDDFSYENSTEKNIVIDKRPVFVIGWHETGISSLRKALTILGYNVLDQSQLTVNWNEGNISKDELLDLASKNEAICNFPWPLLFQELERQYPNALFILTKKDKKSWLNSLKEHTEVNPNKKTDYYIYGFNPQGFSMTKEQEENCIQLYQKHYSNVVKYFSGDKESKLLIMNLDSGDDWKKLCNFLKISEPKRSFPFK